MEQSKLEAMAKEMAKDIKTQEDLSQFSSQLMKMAEETALGAEMESHQGYKPNEKSQSRRGNHRNGSSKKRLIGEHGEIEISTPRDREGSFEPQIIGKRQTRQPPRWSIWLSVRHPKNGPCRSTIGSRA